ncbi:hypothetical protein LY85_0777 [Clostridium sp. KNHs216]|nr:hypothetical protein LY85_0777 [Clostridium sp. KNHs216]
MVVEKEYFRIVISLEKYGILIPNNRKIYDKTRTSPVVCWFSSRQRDSCG